jgi:putative resolvase
MYNISQFSKLINYTIKTLQRWDREGILTPSFRTKTNRRMYTHEQYLEFIGIKETPNSQRKNVIYCRVSSAGQKKDLETQKEYLSMFTMNMGLSIDDVYTDIGSGLNFKRKNFLRLLKEIKNGELASITIAHKDRLCRFGYEMVEFLCDEHNVKINIINNEKLSPEQELCQDLTSIVHVFSSRLYGLRKYKTKIKEMCENSEK